MIAPDAGSRQRAPATAQALAPGGTARLSGWERRLETLIQSARCAPYVLGEHDCFRLACRVIESLTGVDRWPQFAGYGSRREALAAIARHGGSFEAAAGWFFGGAAVAATHARRGDICMVVDAAGQKHLGVCLGVRTACMMEHGLMYVRTAACPCAWRVG